MLRRAVSGRVARSLRRRAVARTREGGAVAVIVALVSSVLFFALAAIGVDAARWAVEVETIQKTADAAALAGVTFVPYDMTSAEATALAVAAKNGYKPDTRTKITISQGSKPSQLRVTISSLVDNQFGRTFGVGDAWITRTAVADYTGPAPMGSPCNTFGNEPPSQPGAAQPTGSALPASPFPNCNWTATKQPQFWGALNGPDTGKVQGDRYMSRRCSGSPMEYACTGASANGNSEYNPLGYFYAIHIEPAAVGTPIEIQIYDPAYVAIDASADTAACSLSFTSDSVNEYTTTDGRKRYSSAEYCTGDFQQTSGGNPGPVTSFALREQTDTNDPMKAALLNPSQCIKQFDQTAKSSSNLTTALRRYTSGTTKNPDYNRQLSQVFHQWVPLCTFTPTRKGDYYLQFRTNVPLGGTAVPSSSETGKTFPSIIYTGNTAVGAATGSLTSGVGLNAFAVRAVPQPLTNDAIRKQISVSGFERMPIFQNATGSTATFNLIRVLPNARGQYIAFDFFDAADASGSGTVKVTAPSDATGSVKSGSGVPNCKSAVNTGTLINLTGCRTTVSSSQNNGQVQHMVVPIPNDYNCDYTSLGGCWFQVEISFGSSTVTDFTTWDANVKGDPVRLVE